MTTNQQNRIEWMEAVMMVVWGRGGKVGRMNFGSSVPQPHCGEGDLGPFHFRSTQLVEYR